MCIPLNFQLNLFKKKCRSRPFSIIMNYASWQHTENTNFSGFPFILSVMQTRQRQVLTETQTIHASLQLINFPERISSIESNKIIYSSYVCFNAYFFAKSLYIQLWQALFFQNTYVIHQKNPKNLGRFIIMRFYKIMQFYKKRNFALSVNCFYYYMNIIIPWRFSQNFKNVNFSKRK